MRLDRIKTLFKESSLYSLSWLAGGFSGIALLPVYTRYIDPTGYGTIQMVEYVTNVLKIALLSGQIPAIYRFWSEADDHKGRSQVIGTGFTYVATTGIVVCLLLLLFQQPISTLLLGPEVDLIYLQLGTGILFAEALLMVPIAYFAASQQPYWYVGYSLSRLAFSIAVNLYMLIGLELGAVGMLAGNLVSSALFVVLMSGHMIVKQGLSPTRALLGPMLRFGMPMVLAVVASALMQNSDRYFLRVYRGLDAVGIYSLGYKLPFFLCSTVMSAVSTAWGSHMIYTVAKDDDASRQIGQVATYYFTVILFLMFAMAVVSPTVLDLLADEQYADARRVAPIVCLGLVFYAFHSFVTSGAYILKRTVLLPIGYLAGLLVSVVLNWMVVPTYGYMGAAWVTSFTYFTFVTVNFVICQSIYPVHFEWSRLGKGAGLALALFGLYALTPALPGYWDLLRQTAIILLMPALLLMSGFLSPNERTLLRDQARKWRLKLLGDTRS